MVGKKTEKPAERTQISFRLAKETLGRVDRLAKKERRNRSNMIEYLLLKSLTGIEQV